MKKYTVYMHITPNKKRYIGITSQKVEKRWNNGNGYKNNKYFTRAIEKYGWDNIEHIIISCDLSEKEAKEMEIDLIKKYDTTNPQMGYNITKGGDGVVGLKWDDEAKDKRSEEYSGEGNPFFNKHHSDETKKKISENKKGKKSSDETKRKISENHRDVSGEKNPMYGVSRYGKDNPNSKQTICLENNKIFDSVSEASKFVNGNASKLIKAMKKNKKYKGYTFMYYKNYIKSLEME